MMRSSSAAAGPIGAILAGGRSRRMGVDKSLVPVGGIPMVQWIVAALKVVVDDVVIVGRDEPLAGIPAIPDLRPRPRGPLAGLVTALHHAAGRPVLLVAVDQPLVHPATLHGGWRIPAIHLCCLPGRVGGRGRPGRPVGRVDPVAAGSTPVS